MDILSTRSVAQVLGVSEATVKRWADAGTLKCFRTPGGHRKFRLRDVKAFLADQEDGGAPQEVTPTFSSLDADQSEARMLAIAGDADGLVSLVANHRLKGAPLSRVFDKIISPAMADIGEAWANGKLSPAQEHVASNAVMDALARVRPLVERTVKTERGRALCACLGNEQHDIGVRAAGLVLAGEGYRTAIAGATVPPANLALMVAAEAPSILALSASPHADPEKLRGDLGIVSAAATTVRTRVFVGGDGFKKLAALPANVKRFHSLEELVAATMQS